MKKADARPKSSDKVFRVVAMGGSAGALEAFEQFFRHLSPDSGAAFVLIPHLDPTHKGIMPELIQRYTGMPVAQARDGVRVRPNSVYVIPPNRDMSIFKRRLQLLEPTAPRGRRMPIDFFFRSLAEDQGENAVSVLLSGMGTDGTLGIKAVKERLGLVVVQEPGSASFASMPQSAIDTGLVDLVGPPEQLPEKMLGHARRFSRMVQAGPAAGKGAAGAFEKVLALLRTHTGRDFSPYKKNMINRRIERRMSLHQTAGMAQYFRLLQEMPHEIDLLFKDLLIGVTRFFRDPEIYDALKKKLLSQMPGIAERGGIYRVWAAGCSSGEEAYSLAMLLLEVFGESGLPAPPRVQIYATDIDAEGIDRARRGEYPANIAADIAPERLARFFVKDGAIFRVRKEIREMVVFAAQNLLLDPPFTRLDLLACRNLLIYLTPETQKRMFPLFHYVLAPGGILFLGSSESINGFTSLFLPLDAKNKLFQRRETPHETRGMIDFPSLRQSPASAMKDASATAAKAIEPSFEFHAQNLILEKLAPPAVLVNDQGVIVYLTRRAGAFLRAPVGKANLNLMAMALEGLRAELGIAMRRAVAERARIVMPDLRINAGDGERLISLSVEPLPEAGALGGLLLVVFEDQPVPAKKPAAARGKAGALAPLRAKNEELEKELQYTREHLQSVIEEMETSQEELKSMNEELQSTNEELQSTNEELQSTKEEQQSLNEELSTLNSELQAKNEELSLASNDMLNLLNSTQIPTVFLGEDLKVRRFTPQATRVANLIPGDVGRPITDIVSDLEYEELAGDVREVVRSLTFREKEIPAKNGSRFMMRIHPYRTMENVIDGVVITFSEISPGKPAAKKTT